MEVHISIGYKNLCRVSAPSIWRPRWDCYRSVGIGMWSSYLLCFATFYCVFINAIILLIYSLLYICQEGSIFYLLFCGLFKRVSESTWFYTDFSPRISSGRGFTTDDWGVTYWMGLYICILSTLQQMQRVDDILSTFQQMQRVDDSH